jgi:putative ABC transport system permease protein
MALMICALGMNDTMDSVINTSYNELNNYESKVTLSESIQSNTLDQLIKDSRNQFLQESAVEVKTEDSLETVSLQIIDQGGYLKFKDVDGSFCKLPDKGALISSITAADLSVDIGDTLTFRPYGSIEFIEIEIAKIIKNPIGQGIFLSSEYYESIGETFLPTSFITDQTDLTLEDGFATIQTKEAMVHTMDEILSMMYVMISIMILAAATLGIVVLYNLGVLSFYEKVRELATLKVLGFQYHRLSNLLQKQNIWLTLSGIIFGLPSGFFVLKFMVQFMGDNFDFEPSVTLSSYAISTSGILILSIGVNRFMSRKLKSIDMVSALKSTE